MTRGPAWTGKYPLASVGVCFDLVDAAEARRRLGMAKATFSDHVRRGWPMPVAVLNGGHVFLAEDIDSMAREQAR